MTVRRPDSGALALRHQRVQRIKRLLHRRSVRQAERAFVVEGPNVLAEALDAGATIEAVFVEQGVRSAVVDRAFEAGVRVYDLSAGVIERISDTATPQPVLAVMPYLDVPLAALAGSDLLVVAVDVRDPGNAGTIIRSAEAAGAGGVVCCDGSVDVFNPKTVRASAGAVFHVPVVAGGRPVEVLEAMASWGVRRLGTAASAGRDYADTDLTGRIAFVLGNEAHGLPPEIAAFVDDAVTIPMVGRTESLNVGMASAVLCFEAARQRRRAAVAASPR